MEWFIKNLISIITFPVEWFWETLESFRKEGSIWKVILLFIVSLSGLGLLLFVLIWISSYMVTYHPEWLVIAGLIAWLYAYVHSKMKKDKTPSATPSPAVDLNKQQLQSQGNKEYARMRTIMYQTLKEVAPQIGGVVPRLLSEIEVAETRYIIAHDIIFYQFKLKKADMRARYSLDDLAEFKETVQSMISNLANSGKFPTLQLQSYQTIYGNWLCGVTVDVIEDLDSHFIIQTVFASPEYAEYQHNIQLNQQNTDITTLPDATWDEFDS